MNYRHAFHAGNFADLVKHAALMALLARMTGKGPPLTVVDTHAGAGLYDLAGGEAQRSGEAEAGVGRLLAAADAPAPLAALAKAVREANAGKDLRYYPGSPSLIARALRPRDRYLAFELRPEEHGALARTLRGRAGVETRCADGFAAAASAMPASGPALVLIDPPFERADDYARTVRTVRALLACNRQAVAMVWLPLKDLATFDGFLSDLQDAVGRTPILVAEARLRPLSDPMKMNGCALAIVQPPADFASPLQAICGWVAGSLGEKGASARIWTPA